MCFILLLDVNFIPFGFEEGDISTSDGNVSSLGPFDLPTPVVYYLRKEHQIYVSNWNRYIRQGERDTCIQQLDITLITYIMCLRECRVGKFNNTYS